MELYFKDLISEDASLEKLVDDLSRVIHGADDYAKAIGATVSPETRDEVTGRLAELRQNCRRLKQQAMSGARATDKLLRARPYSFLAVTFAAGLLVGATWFRRR
ncbi:MAG: hypothetical protein ACTHLW_07190 [Verrucomicrobiota bacterium]